MYKNWCGKPCCECAEQCDFDKTNTCSPDCPNLSEEGNPSQEECLKCDAFMGKRITLKKWCCAINEYDLERYSDYLRKSEGRLIYIKTLEEWAAWDATPIIDLKGLDSFPIYLLLNNKTFTRLANEFGTDITDCVLGAIMCGRTEFDCWECE